MSLRDLLIRISEVYEPEDKASRDLPGQALLLGVRARQDLPWPAGCTALGYGGQGNASRTPWIGVFDPAINDKPGEGLYLAYIYSSDLSAVTLTLQQGITSLIDTYGKGAKLHRYLMAQAATLRGALRPTLADGWRDELHLFVESKYWRSRSYEKANVAARRYELARMPSDDTLAEHLTEGVQLLRDAAAADRVLFQVPQTNEPVLEYPDPQHGGFRPRSSTGYSVVIQGGMAQRRQEHEALLTRFAQHAYACGYEAINTGVHPRDVVLRHSDHPGQDWLVEAKTVLTGKEYLAGRAAVGQLFEYRHVHYTRLGGPPPHLVALFTADVGDYADYLETLGIASLWEHPGGWGGSSLVTEWGLTT
ncbi:MrcB family domain-containing protein [Streptomyces sp. NPDC057116]|uniref:MrcB family domain-containing protein n=1 Tax=Streptomyces sp. NPDC057116 TaxID=3346023 RepID=UPI0036308C0F